MLSVEAVFDPLGFVYLVQHPVGVVLHGRCEDDHFVYLCHFCEELVAAWADQEGALAANFEVMDESLVEVEHEAVAGATFLLGQVGWIRCRQRFVPADGRSTDAIERR